MAFLSKGIKEKFITVKEAAEILGLKENTVHNLNGGTAGLKRVRQGRRVFLLLSEVERHKEELLLAA